MTRITSDTKPWVLGFALVGGSVVFSSSLMDPAGLPKWWWVVALSAAGLALVAVRAGATYALEGVPAAVVWIGAVFALSLAMSTFALANETMRALMGTYSRWTGAGAYLAYLGIAWFAALSLRDTRSRSSVQKVVVLTSVAVGLYGVLQRLGLDPIEWNVIYADSAIAFLSNPNFASAYLGMTVPLVVAGGVDTRRTKAFRWHVAAGVVILGGLVATGSPLGLLPALVGAGTAVLVWFFTSGSARDRLRSVWIGGVALAVGIGALATMWLGLLPVPGPMSIRFYYWRTALGMFADYPVTGVGLGRFDDFFRRYRPADQIADFGRSSLADNPHSVPLTLLAEGGLLVFVPWLVVMGTVLWLAAKWIRANRAPDASRGTRLAVATWVGAFVGYLTQAAVNFDFPSLALLGWVFAGGVIAQVTSATEVRLNPRFSTPVAVAAIAGALAVAVAAWIPVSADAAAGDASRLAASGLHAEAAARFAEAADKAWWEPRYAFFAAQSTFLAGNREAALELFESAARRFPEAFEPAIGAARAAAELGDLERAADWYAVVLRLEPNQPDIRSEAQAAIDAAG